MVRSDETSPRVLLLTSVLLALSAFSTGAHADVLPPGNPSQIALQAGTVLWTTDGSAMEARGGTWILRPNKDLPVPVSEVESIEGWGAGTDAEWTLQRIALLTHSGEIWAGYDTGNWSWPFVWTQTAGVPAVVCQCGTEFWTADGTALFVSGGSWEWWTSHNLPAALTVAEVSEAGVWGVYQGYPAAHALLTVDGDVWRAPNISPWNFPPQAPGDPNFVLLAGKFLWADDGRAYSIGGNPPGEWSVWPSLDLPVPVSDVASIDALDPRFVLVTNGGDVFLVEDVFGGGWELLPDPPIGPVSLSPSSWAKAKAAYRGEDGAN
ncbi:hypothetical protein K8I85_09415 [bacterium]|nr:hypothetical protein [bacterium]